MKDKEMKLLIDGDLLVYRVAWTTLEDPEGIARYRMDTMIDKILNDLGTDDAEYYLTSTDKSNFRLEVYPEYKANRKTEKPKHYDFLRSYLIEEYSAIQAFGEEADDLLGINQKAGETIIVSIDKDLDQIPGSHYNFVKELLYDVSEMDGRRWFYKQLLIGDTSDNVKGITGIGPIRASKLIDHLNTEREMYEVVLKEYEAEFKEHGPNQLIQNGQVLKIRRTKGEVWSPPL